MERIMIIGCGGAGKSTLARALGEKLALPVKHLDQLFWRPGWIRVSQEEFDSLLQQELEKPKWILDGNFNRTIPLRLEKCDTVIYLDFNRVTCLLGVAKRVICSYGRVRTDMAEGCPERFDLDFLKWIWNFNEKNRSRYYQLLSHRQDIRVVILKNRRQVNHFLSSL